MKRVFIIKVVLFLIPLLAFAVGIETFVRSIPNSYSYKKQWMEGHKDSVETIILGNSHMYAAIDASLMRNAFNLSNSAQRLEIDSWLLSEYIDKCPNLKNVLVNIDDMNLFSSDYENSDKLWNRAIYYNLYMNYPKHGNLSMYHYEISCPMSTCSKIERFILSVATRKIYNIDCDSLGRGTNYGADKQRPKELEETIIARLNNEDVTTDVADSRLCKNTPYLYEIAKLCNNHHVRLILLSTPYWYLYNRVADKSDVDTAENFAIALARKYNIEYGNFRKDNRICNNKKYFVDCHHLSDEGSEVFTAILKETYKLE